MASGPFLAHATDREDGYDQEAIRGGLSWWDDDELVERQPRNRRGGRSWCFAEKDEW